jgi:hypothetical protein
MKKILVTLAVLSFLLQTRTTFAALPVTGEKLWLDSTTYDSEPNTLYTDSACTAGNEATGNGTEVQCWKDKSGNGHNVKAWGSGHGNPSIIASSGDFNSHTVLSFSKSEKDTLRYVLDGDAWSGDYTMFIIFRQTASAANKDAFFSSGSGTKTHFQITYSDASTPWFLLERN